MSIRLAIFDVDGTLLRGDTICQAIARGLGKYERMCEFERWTGEERILSARKEMAEWYLTAGESVVRSHLTAISWAPGAHEGIAELQRAGIEVALASVTWSFAVEHVAQTLNVKRRRSTELDFATGSVTHTWGNTKAEFLTEVVNELGVSVTDVAAVGDSSGDYEMLRTAGTAIFVGTEPPDLEQVTHMPEADIRDVAKLIRSI